MASAKDASGQRKMEFGLADGSVRDRRVQLGRVVSDLRLDSDAAMLLLLVFDQTAVGTGTAWAAADELVLGHALGPKCSQTKFYKSRRAMTEAGILSVVKDRAEGTLRRHYKIDWEGVYAVRGLPLPDHLRAADSCGVFSPRENSPRENSRGENSPREKTGGENHNMSRAHTPARARLSSCLLVLCNVVDDKTFRQGVLGKARDIHRDIHAHRPDTKLDAETRRFVASVAVIASAAGGPWAEWIDYAVAITKRAKAASPGAYLRGTLRRSLVEFAGVCANDEEASATMGQLLSAARPLAKGAIRTDVGKTAVQHEPRKTSTTKTPAADRLPRGSGREMVLESFRLAEVSK